MSDLWSRVSAIPLDTLIGLVSLALSILFYGLAKCSQRKLDGLAARIAVSVDEVEATLHRYRGELAAARQVASLRGLCLTVITDATEQARAVTARDLMQVVTERGKDWWHLREELRGLRLDGVVAFADPLTPETRIELRPD